MSGYPQQQGNGPQRTPPGGFGFPGPRPPGQMPSLTPQGSGTMGSGEPGRGPGPAASAGRGVPQRPNVPGAPGQAPSGGRPFAPAGISRPIGAPPAGAPPQGPAGVPGGMPRPSGLQVPQRAFSGGFPPGGPPPMQRASSAGPAARPAGPQRPSSGGAAPGGGPQFRPMGFGPPRPGGSVPPAQQGAAPPNGVAGPQVPPPAGPGQQRPQAPFYQPPPQQCSMPSPGPSGPPSSMGPGPPQFQGGPPRGQPGGFAPPAGPPSFGGGGGPPTFGGGGLQQPGLQTTAPPGFRPGGVGTNAQLERFESLSVTPAGPGQPPGLSPALLPRPLGDDAERGTEAPKLAHPRNCSAKFMRVTVSAIPSQQGLRARYQLPIGAIVHPLADPQDVPIVTPDTPGIIRCRRCRTYINPFVTWQDGGRRFSCNVCDMLNEIPVEYFSQLDHNGVRLDLEQRPELCGGSVEYLAPQEYMVRPPMPPVYFFVIDVSVTAVNSGMLATAAAAIKSALDSLPGAERTRIGFLTYDQHLHFYSLKASLTQPQMMVVSEIEEPFVPQPDDLLVNLQESRAVIDAFLDGLPTVFLNNLSAESAMGPALQAAFMVISPLGGKLLLFQAAVPSLGCGKIKNRDNHSMWNTDQEHKLRVPEDAFWKKYAAECSRVQIAVDVFSFCREYTDLASIGSLPKYTCGQLYYYPSFNREKDGIKLTHEIVHNLTRTTGWEAVMRIRCSKGLRVSGFHGHFFIRSTDLLALPQVDPDKAFAVQIAHEENVVTSAVSYIQCALLYTSSTGERRIRVHTLMLPVVNDIGELYNTADGGAMATLIAKLAIEKSYQSKLEETRNAIQNKLVVALKEYRLLHSQQASQGRMQLPHNLLIYPSTLRLLPLLTLGLMKSAAIRGSARDVVIDERIAVGLDLMSASVPTMLRLLYPSLYALHDPAGNWGKPPGENGKMVLPPLVPLSSEVLFPSGAYLLDNGRVFVLWLGREVSSHFLHEVFGIDPKTNKPSDAAGSSLSVEPARPTELSQRINAVLHSLRNGRANYQKCFSVRQGSAQEHHVLPYFVEDRSAGQFSYMDFITTVHKQVLSK